MNINFKEKLVSAVSSIPLIAGATMSASCGVSCPYGLSCSYPGECRRYTDAGGDGICDLGQTSSSSTDTASSSTYDDSSSSSSTDSSSYDPASSAQDQADTSTSVVDAENTNDSNVSAVTDPGGGVDSSLGDNPNYFVIPVSMLLIGLYLFTSFLFTRGILDQKKHRRIWNILLTAGMAGSGITGILLIMIINLSIKTALNPSLTFWHVELSILMVIATVIHLHLYRKPFKKMFKVLFGIKNSTTKKYKKPASILALVMVISMMVVSGQYLSSNLTGDESLVTNLNSTNNTTLTETGTSTTVPETSTSTTTSTSSSNTDGVDEQSTTYTTDTSQTYSQDTSSKNGNRNGKT